MSERQFDLSWFVYSTITKEVTEQDSIIANNNRQQNQTEILKFQSQISVNIEIDYSVQPSNLEKQYLIKFSIIDNSTLKRSESYQNVYYTNLLKQINQNLDLMSKTVISIQDRFIKQNQNNYINIQNQRERHIIIGCYPNNNSEWIKLLSFQWIHRFFINYFQIYSQKNQFIIIFLLKVQQVMEMYKYNQNSVWLLKVYVFLIQLIIHLFILVNHEKILIQMEFKILNCSKLLQLRVCCKCWC
ncbi:unnamed protein product [Paramecium primaurelia]|uniref:Transmembrane protein n=1 Tax=Paramecium primaurelia TaxID=5886 RepID=A0A8S1N1L2_PARPR|nr:unnamed protein product [Paramecium primaurelia]